MGASQSAPATPQTTVPQTPVKRAAGEPDTVIIPVDGSKQAEAAFLWYKNHVHRDNNTVHVINCQELTPGASVIEEKAYGYQGYCDHVHKSNNVVRLVHCHELDHSAPLAGEQFKVESWAEMVERTRQDGMQLVRKYEDKLKEKNIQGSVQFEVGKPGEIVMSFANKYNGTHIIMGTRGFGLLRRTVLGSVSEYVIHHAKIPVTVVPPETQHWFF